MGGGGQMNCVSLERMILHQGKMAKEGEKKHDLTIDIMMM